VAAVGRDDHVGQGSGGFVNRRRSDRACLGLKATHFQEGPLVMCCVLPGALGNLFEALDDRARLSCQPGEFDVADRLCAAQRETHYFR
jgi:hypothetical protein